MLNTVNPTIPTMQGTPNNKPADSALSQKADAIVQKVQQWASSTHETMDQMRFGSKLNILG